MDCYNSVVCILAVFIGICFVLFGLTCLFCVIVCLCWVVLLTVDLFDDLWLVIRFCVCLFVGLFVLLVFD